MSDFPTQVNDIPCICHVTHYSPYQPARGMFGAMEDAEEAIPSEFEFQILDPDGTLWDGVRLSLISDKDMDRLEEEYEASVLADKHGKDF